MTTQEIIPRKTPGDEFVEWAIKHVRLKDVYDQFDFPNDATDFNTMRASIVNKINKIVAQREIDFGKWLNNSWHTPHYGKWIHLREGLAGMKTTEELHDIYTQNKTSNGNTEG